MSDSGGIEVRFTQQDIHQALEEGEFVPYFQPIVDLRAGNIHGFEILARWQHPTRGHIPPSLFIPAVGRYGRFLQTSAFPSICLPPVA